MRKMLVLASIILVILAAGAGVLLSRNCKTIERKARPWAACS
jgi:hypothetical protein